MDDYGTPLPCADCADMRAEVERLRAALEEIRGLTKCASDVVIIRLSSIAAQALYPDWRNGGVALEVK